MTCQHCDKPMVSMSLDEFNRVKREQRDEGASYTMLMVLDLSMRAFAGHDFSQVGMFDIGTTHQGTQDRVRRHLKDLYDSGIIYRKSKEIVDAADQRRANRERRRPGNAAG